MLLNGHTVYWQKWTIGKRQIDKVFIDNVLKPYLKSETIDSIWLQENQFCIAGEIRIYHYIPDSTKYKVSR